MEGNIDLYYVDAVLNYNLTPEEMEEDIKRLKKESDALTDWPPM